MPRDPGFSIEPHVFNPAAIAALLGALEYADLARTKAGVRHLLSVPVVRDLAADPRMRELASRFIGGDAEPFRATLFDKSAQTNWLVVWHQDTALPLRQRTDDPAWGPWSMKSGIIYAHAPAAALESVVALRVSLDDSTTSNGPLRVLPDSHTHGILSDAEIGRWAAETNAVDCVTSAGGVVVMRPLTLHASSKSIDGRSRRVLHIEYAATLDVGPGLKLALC